MAKCARRKPSFVIAVYTTLLVLVNSNRLYYANGIEIDEPPPQLQQLDGDGEHTFRDTSIISDGDNLISFTNQTRSDLINSHSKQTKHDRIRRNSILTLGSHNGGLLGNNFSPVPQVQPAAATAPAQQNLEGLLASCQLTNLLLYQLVNNQQQQKAVVAPGLLAAPATPFLSPFNPFLQPAVGPLLTTYITTSTYTTKMTSTDVITIPLLFGNKPSPTTVTRTKTYDVTTSTELTLTSTILPTTTTTTVIQIVPSAEVAGLTPTKANKYGADAAIEPSVIGGHYETPILNALNPDDASTAPSTPTRSKKKRKNRPSSSQKQGRVLQLQYQDELAEVNNARGSSPAYKYGQREKQQLIELKSPSIARGNTKFRRQYIYEDDTTQLENPDYYIADYYPSEIIHHNQQRLKRRGEVDSVDAGSRPDEFILEPSFDSSSNVQLAEECPATTVTQTVTVTSTKTVTKTKLINPATAALSGLVVKETDSLHNNNINYEATNRAKKNFISTRGSDSRRSSSSNSNGSGSGFSSSRSKGRAPSASNPSTTERSSSSERRRSSYRQRSTTPDSLFLSSSTNNYYSHNLNPNSNSNGNSDINSRRSRSRFHANYYAGRASY